ncbi:MAG: CBS domain-containing protein [Sulfuricella sp.]|jgi:CBS-domain-containing membrane protein|nr:CBS domain-containing protein [Sulfuricella sp.]
MKTTLSENPETDSADDELPEMELTDGDILDAMQHIPGYLDITTEDFRTIYHLAHHHAVRRLFGKVRAENLMRAGIEPLLPDMPLDQAAMALVRSGYKALPVVDAAGSVIGMLTETDFLRRLKVNTFLELLLSMLDGAFEFRHRCHETLVSEAMTSPVITVARDAGFEEIVRAFHRHDGRSIPVVDGAGRLLGLLLRKDFFSANHLEALW